MLCSQTHNSLWHCNVLWLSFVNHWGNVTKWQSCWSNCDHLSVKKRCVWCRRQMNEGVWVQSLTIVEAYFQVKSEWSQAGIPFKRSSIRNSVIHYELFNCQLHALRRKQEHPYMSQKMLESTFVTMCPWLRSRLLCVLGSGGSDEVTQIVGSKVLNWRFESKSGHNSCPWCGHILLRLEYETRLI